MKTMITAVGSDENKTIYDEACDVCDCMSTLQQLIMVTNISLESGVGIKDISKVMELIEASAENISAKMKAVTEMLGATGLANLPCSRFINMADISLHKYNPNIQNSIPEEKESPCNKEI